MIKIDWKELLYKHNFLGFYGWLNMTEEPGRDFHIGWNPLLIGTPKQFQSLLVERIRV